jgi:hypothetical protein
MLALVLAGCNSDWIRERDRFEQANTTPPTSYRTDVVAFMRTYLNDPAKVRDAFISEPALRTLENASRYTVCLRYTVPKSNGQYGGSKDSLVLFRDGRLDRIVDNASNARTRLISRSTSSSICSDSRRRAPSADELPRCRRERIQGAAERGPDPL